MFCASESGDGACMPRSTVGECDTVARCGAGTCATVTVVDAAAVADLERFVAICSGRIGESGGESGPGLRTIESSRLRIRVSHQRACTIYVGQNMFRAYLVSVRASVRIESPVPPLVMPENERERGRTPPTVGAKLARGMGCPGPGPPAPPPAPART